MTETLAALRGIRCLPALLLATGCVHAHFVPTGAAYPARPADCDIEVFASGVPAREFVEIGVVEGRGTEWKADLEDVLPRFREEACLAGGDALILNSADRYVSGGDDLETLNLYAFATVIRWTGR